MKVIIEFNDDVKSAILTVSRYQAQIKNPQNGEMSDNPITAEQHIQKIFARVGENSVRQMRQMQPVDGITATSE